ncbi:MAG: glycoside hydrolase family 71/99-like protein [Verrucomicrobiales bacterium]
MMTQTLRPTTLVWLLAVAGSLCWIRPATSAEVDTSTLRGKVMCGYQGWFNCEGDGAGLAWTHWARGRGRLPGPGNITVDLWPDMKEYGAAERYATDFKNADGSPAEVFSSHNRQTVLRHFDWMREYGIDGAFVQRFANGLRGGRMLRHKDVVLGHCREGAKSAGRAYAVMYDLSGIRRGGTAVVREDWARLRGESKITADAAYLKHEGKPLVAVWGIGFGDGRDYSLDECQELVEFLKSDGCAVMLGVPTGWRRGERDAVKDPQLKQIIALADVVSPWTIGRYRSPEQAARHGEKVLKPDLAWCRERDIDFLPVVFPGFSWSNLKGGQEQLGAIPRLKGRFLWSQFVAAKRAGCEMIYVAMFDEVDEGTAIFKCSDNPPNSGKTKFLTLEGLPSDYYLRLTGAGARLLRGELPMGEAVPDLRN